MKIDQLILVGAVAFAGLLVAQKTGVLKKTTLSSVPWPSFTFNNDTALTASNEEKGYDPVNPGNYVTTDDLIKGVADNDWGYIPPTFDQKADGLLYAPAYPWM